MKTCSLIPALLLPLALAATAAPDDLHLRFELERPLDGTFEPGQRGRVVIPGDVFGESRSFPDDVRIFDAEGTQWPCFLHVPKEEVAMVSFDLDILNSAWVEGPEPCLQFDIAFPPAYGGIPVHNQLELITTGSEFVRRVEIFAGDDRAGHMATGYLLEFARRSDARNRIIRYPDCDLPRLHVRIYPNAQAAGESFRITRARLHHRTEKEQEREQISFSRLPVDGRDRDDHAQILILDTGHTGRPAEFIRFEVANDSYARCVSVYGRNSEHEAWRRVGGGEIHALPDDRNDTIRLHANARYLKLQVFHYDDQPLDIPAVHLEAFPRYLVFEAGSAGPAALCYRAWDVAAPRYDLRSRIEGDEIEALPIIETRDVRPNARARTRPWRKYSRLLAGLAVGAVSLLVVWIIVGMLRQQPLTGGDE